MRTRKLIEVGWRLPPHRVFPSRSGTSASDGTPPNRLAWVQSERRSRKNFQPPRCPLPFPVFGPPAPHRGPFRVPDAPAKTGSCQPNAQPNCPNQTPPLTPPTASDTPHPLFLQKPCNQHSAHTVRNAPARSVIAPAWPLPADAKSSAPAASKVASA